VIPLQNNSKYSRCSQPETSKRGRGQNVRILDLEGLRGYRV